MISSFANASLFAALLVTFIALAIVVFRRRLHRQLPAFAAYIYFYTFAYIALLAMSIVVRPLVYFYAYWTAGVLEYALLFFVVNELFVFFTDQIKWLSSRGRGLLLRIAGLAAVIAIAASLNPPHSRYPVMMAIASLQRGLGLSILTFMGVSVAFARIYDVKLPRRQAGIAIGLFLAYSFQTLWPSVNAYLPGHPDQKLYNWTIALLQLLGALVWLYVMLHENGKDESPESRRTLILINKKNKQPVPKPQE